MKQLRRAWSGLLAALILTTPRIADACSVCSAGRDEENRLAFILTTIFLSVTPLLVVGGAVLFIVRKLRAADRELAARNPNRGHHPRPTAIG